MSRTFPSEWKKVEMNSKPWSEVTCEGTPCMEKTWKTNSLANIGDCDGVNSQDKDQLLGEAVNDDQYHVRAIGHG